MIFKGSCFIKYSARKEAIKVIKKCNYRSNDDFSKGLMIVEEGG